MDALRALGLRQFKVHMGQVAFFKELLRDIPLDPERWRLRQAIQVKDHVTFHQLLAALSLPPGVEATLSALLDLHGGPGAGASAGV